MAGAHGDVHSVTADVPVLNVSLLYVNEHLDDAVGPSIQQLTTDMHQADERVTACEENIDNVKRTQNASHLALASVIPDYIRLMSEDVSSLEATRQRIQEAVGGTVGVLEALNATVNDIETRSAAALNDSRHATQLAQSALTQQQHLADDVINIRGQLNASDTDIRDVSTSISDITAAVDQILTSTQAVHDNVTMATSDAIDLSAAWRNVTQLEADATNLDGQLQQSISRVTATADDVNKAGNDTRQLVNDVGDTVEQWKMWLNRATAAQQSIDNMTSQAEMTSSRARSMLDILADFDARSQEKQRRANESLVAVNAVLQLSRQVVNESRTLQSSLETTEATALTALHRATQQHTAVRALKQSVTDIMRKLSSLQSTLVNVSSNSTDDEHNRNVTSLFDELTIINSTSLSASAHVDQLSAATDDLEARRSTADAAVRWVSADSSLSVLRSQLAAIRAALDSGTSGIAQLRADVNRTRDELDSRTWNSVLDLVLSRMIEYQTWVDSVKLRRDSLRVQLARMKTVLAMLT